MPRGEIHPGHAWGWGGSPGLKASLLTKAEVFRTAPWFQLPGSLEGTCHLQESPWLLQSPSGKVQAEQRPETGEVSLPDSQEQNIPGRGKTQPHLEQRELGMLWEEGAREGLEGGRHGPQRLRAGGRLLFWGRRAAMAGSWAWRGSQAALSACRVDNRLAGLRVQRSAGRLLRPPLVWVVSAQDECGFGKAFTTRQFRKPYDTSQSTKHLAIDLNLGFALFSSVAQLCPTLCDPMDSSTPGLPVRHQLPEFTQTHAHWVGDAIQPSHPLSSPSPPAFIVNNN